LNGDARARADAFSAAARRRLAGRLRALGAGLLELVWPARCAGCGAPPQGAPGPLCPRCRGQLPPAPLLEAPPGLVSCSAAVAFEGPAALWIHRFKHPAPGLAGLDTAAEVVACALVREAVARTPGPAPEWVVPVPPHLRALRRRGFDPAAVLAREVARRTGARLATHALRRTDARPGQTGRSRAERRRLARGAFRCTGPVPGAVWLVDDVVTTGATLAECARVLRRAGARRVAAVGMARTPLDGLDAPG